MSAAPIAVIVAMDTELVHLVDDLAHPTGHLGGRARYDLIVAGSPVVAVHCGIGMLNAAATTERVVAELAPSAILNYGCAGAHRDDLLLGDVVIVDRAVYTASLTILRDGTERHTGADVEVAVEDRPPADLPADPTWLAAARVVAESHVLAPWPDNLAWPAGVPRRIPRVHIGAVASADIWTQEIARIATISERHGTYCEDMEAAAVAHVARLHGVPFLSVKDISNNELHAETDLDDFAEFPMSEVGKRAATVLTATIERWAAGQS